MQELKSDRKLIIGMVGLPARGKTYISRKITRFLTWQGYKAKFFNIGNYRRHIFGNHPSEEFFDPNNIEAVKKRDECALLALQDLIGYLKTEGDIAIYDGTNTPKSRRIWIKEFLDTNLPGSDIIWVESICNDEESIGKNIKQAKMNNPDFVGVEPENVIADFNKRIDNYKKVYEPTSKDDYPYIRIIKIINFGKMIKLFNIQGFLKTNIASYLINLYPYPRPIYLIKNAYTKDREEINGKRGGDSELSEKGIRYAHFINLFFQREAKTDPEFNNSSSITSQKAKILCSTMKRSVDTAKMIELGVDPIFTKNLDQIDFGTWDGKTDKEMEEQSPAHFEKMKQDSFYFRYPRGESYSDLVHRIVPVIFEIERSQSPVIIVAHQSTLRCVYAYFTKNEIQDIPFHEIPANTIIKLVPEVYFCNEKRFAFNLTTGKFSEKESMNTLTLSPLLKIKKQEDVMEVSKFDL